MFYILFNSLTKKYFQFSGRANRKEYIVFTVFFFFLFEFLKLFSSKDYSNFDIRLMGFKEIEFSAYITLFFVLFITIPSISIDIRRLHDLNFSGWWIWFIFLLNMLGVIFFEQYIFLFEYIRYIIDAPLLILKGTSGANKYGEEPIY
ncbi:DUF805 domain-containing protein [Candidatus Trichorickettsia mobilis]|uniref:DUF805 domain-containing protein n=1 Tax=Candidatus Trichorickettsia mobilis TaxID=1346319 RepID=A0ABZ0UTB2_9RICK|nr:DUF805 domain-containing protein [Candidatus Trichorickettsia mobilis]WPY00203.1 DUF805 domain-containing protein [Candidatus Trichorickettsia mobilis]